MQLGERGDVADLLQDDGHLTFDVMTCQGLERLDSYTTKDRADRVRILGFIWEAEARRSTMKIPSYAPSARPGSRERASNACTEWGRSVRDIRDRLRRADFDEPERLWTTTEDPETDERFAVIARRI